MPDSPKFNCGCPSGKSCFASWDRAEAEIRAFHRRRIKRPGKYISVYRCGIGACRCWHIGSTEKTLDKRHVPLQKRQIGQIRDRQASKSLWKENLRKVGEWLKKIRGEEGGED